MFFQDEARIGQKGRTCHVWWKRGERPRGIADKRFTFAYIFAAVEPGTDNAFALILPYGKHSAKLSITHNSGSPDFRTEFYIGKARNTAPDDDNAGWWVTGAREIAAEAGKFGNVECQGPFSTSSIAWVGDNVVENGDLS